MVMVDDEGPSAFYSYLQGPVNQKSCRTTSNILNGFQARLCGSISTRPSMALEGYWYLQTSRFNEWASNSIYGFWRLTAKIIVDGWLLVWQPAAPCSLYCQVNSEPRHSCSAYLSGLALLLVEPARRIIRYLLCYKFLRSSSSNTIFAAVE